MAAPGGRALIGSWRRKMSAPAKLRIPGLPSRTFVSKLIKPPSVISLIILGVIHLGGKSTAGLSDPWESARGG